MQFKYAFNYVQFRMYPDHNKYDNNNSVADPYHFDVDPVPALECEKFRYGSRANFDMDPDPGKNNTDQDPDQDPDPAKKDYF